MHPTSQVKWLSFGRHDPQTIQINNHVLLRHFNNYTETVREQKKKRDTDTA
jgi:hypothetical protein